MDQTPDLEWCVGVSLGILGTLFATLSKIYMKKAHMVTEAAKLAAKEEADAERGSRQSDDDDDDDGGGPGNTSKAVLLDGDGGAEGAEDLDDTKVPMTANCYFAIGMLLLFFNPVCDIAAFAFAPQSVVSGTAGSATIWSLVFAPWLLGERRTWIDIIGGVIVCVGCIGVGVFGPKDTPDYTYDQIIGYFERTGFLVFAAGVAVLYAVMAMCCRLDEDTRFQFARKLSFGCIGGSVGGFYVFLKVSLALVTLGPEGQWDQWQPWVFLVLAGVFAGGGIVLLNEGLKRYDAIFVGAAYQASLVVMGVASGAAFFLELNVLKEGEIVAFSFSVLLCIIGTATCVMAPQESEESEEDANIRLTPLGEGMDQDAAMFDAGAKDLGYDPEPQADSGGYLVVAKDDAGSPARSPVKMTSFVTEDDQDAVAQEVRDLQAKIAADQARVSKLEEVLSGLDNQDNNQDNNQDTAGATSNAGEGQRKNQLDALNVSHQGDANASLVITEQGTTDI